MCRLLTVVALVFLSAASSWGQLGVAPARFTLRVGAGYDQGDFGSPETSKALYAPVSLRYTGGRFDLGVTSAFAQIDTAGGIRLIDGVPTQTNLHGGPLQETGLGDTTIRSRFFLVMDEGPGTSRPSVTPFVKIKIPTAPEERGLGTGKFDYGFGVELDKEVGPVLLFGDLDYTIVGKTPTLGFRNRPSASFGVGKQVSENVTVSGMLEWRRAISMGNPNPAELAGVLSYKVNPRVILSPNVYAGLTNGSPDFGFGMQISYKF